MHLDPFSGLQYVLHLFDSSQDVFSRLTLSDSSRIDLALDHSRALENRVTVVEQDHARVIKSFELQSAITAEALECQENMKNEAFIMVQGLPRLPKLDSKEWQVRARSDVDQVLASMGFDYRVKFVQNSTGRGANSKTLYKARLENETISREVRDKFSSYFAGGNDSRPASLSAISVRNCVTPGTLARVAILQLLAKRYKESNPGSRVQVVAYESRPILRLTPPPTSSDTRTMTFTFIEAISKLPTSFDQVEVDGLMKRISPRLHGSLRSTFIVISDDMLSTAKKVTKKSSKSAAQSSQSSSQGSSRSIAAASSDVADVASDQDSSEFRTPEGPPREGRKRGASGGSGPIAKR